MIREAVTNDLFARGKTEKRRGGTRIWERMEYKAESYRKIQWEWLLLLFPLLKFFQVSKQIFCEARCLFQVERLPRFPRRYVDLKLRCAASVRRGRAALVEPVPRFSKLPPSKILLLGCPLQRFNETQGVSDATSETSDKRDFHGPRKLTRPEAQFTPFKQGRQ